MPHRGLGLGSLDPLPENFSGSSLEEMCKNLSPTKTRRGNCLVLPHTGYALDCSLVTSVQHCCRDELEVILNSLGMGCDMFLVDVYIQQLPLIPQLVRHSPHCGLCG